MSKRLVTMAISAVVLATIFAMPAIAGKPNITKTMLDFDFPVVDCGDFQVWTTGSELDTEKWWFDENGDPLRFKLSVHIKESIYYNNMYPDNFVSQGKNGVGEGFSYELDFTSGDEHWSGLLFRITIPGVGHVLLDAGTWKYDASEDVLVHHGPAYALAEGETGLALCEALE